MIILYVEISLRVCIFDNFSWFRNSRKYRISKSLLNKWNHCGMNSVTVSYFFSKHVTLNLWRLNTGWASETGWSALNHYRSAMARVYWMPCGPMVGQCGPPSQSLSQHRASTGSMLCFHWIFEKPWPSSPPVQMEDAQFYVINAINYTQRDQLEHSINVITISDNGCISQQSQNICIAFVQCRHNVFDVGPTLYKCYTNV